MLKNSPWGSKPDTTPCHRPEPESKDVAVETLPVVLGDQPSHSLSALSNLDPAKDVVQMAEAMDECTYVPHHLKKIVLAMRHFAHA